MTTAGSRARSEEEKKRIIGKIRKECRVERSNPGERGSKAKVW
jgi:hypothetical protein